jgi:hypothetical protein
MGHRRDQSWPFAATALITTTTARYDQASPTNSTSEVAEQAAHLTVFQRTPNFSLPAQNGPVTYLYDALGRLRFVYIIDRWSGTMTASIYFDESEKRVWQTYKRVKGEPTPGTFGPFNDEQLLKNPEERFKSPSDCREIQRKIRQSFR